MKVQDIMTREVETCRLSATLTQVVRLMQEGRCGIVPVIDEGGKLSGVITDRDVSLELLKTSRKPINVAAHEVMTSPVHACGPDDDVRTALSTMTRFKVRRLPVTGAAGSLLGILSMDDIIVRALADDAPSAAEIVSSLREIVSRGEELAGQSRA